MTVRLLTAHELAVHQEHGFTCYRCRADATHATGRGIQACASHAAMVAKNEARAQHGLAPLPADVTTR